MPSRSDLQTLAYQRITEANALLPLQFIDAAFYLAGYSVECALKAAICKTLDQDDFYESNRTNKAIRYVQDRVLREFKTHNYNDLLVLSGLSAKFEQACQVDNLLDGAWSTIRALAWSEQSRYQSGTKSTQDTYAFIEAANVMVLWISKFW